MQRIHDWTSRFDYGVARQAVQDALGRCNAFREDLKNYRLIFPENPADSTLTPYSSTPPKSR